MQVRAGSLQSIASPLPDGNLARGGDRGERSTCPPRVIRVLAALPLIAAAVRAEVASAQTSDTPVKVDAKGLVAKIKFEAPLAGFLGEINGKYKLRVTELTLAPGGQLASIITWVLGSDR